MSEHAKFSFSAAHRWMECPGSITASKDIPNTSSPQADLGTRLHAVAADVLEGREHGLQGDEAQIVNDYVDYVREISKTPMTKLLVEQRVTLSQDVWGTCDAIVIQPYVMHIIDLKTGSRRVDAKQNAQLLGYAAAALNEFNVLPSPVHHEIYPVDIKLHIAQPSINWFDTWTVSAHEVSGFVKKIDKAVTEANSVSPSYRPSEEACKYCPARSTCRARAEFNFELAVTEFALASPPTLTPEEIDRILPYVPQIAAWAESIQEHATTMALRGHSFKGHRLVESGGLRKWKSPESAIAAMIEAGLAPDIVRKVTPVGIGDAEKLLGKKHQIFADHTVRGAVKPVLARENDRRKDWNGIGDFPEN